MIAPRHPVPARWGEWMFAGEAAEYLRLPKTHQVGERR
jgi:hypothetical protein